MLLKENVRIREERAENKEEKWHDISNENLEIIEKLEQEKESDVERRARSDGW